MDVATLSGMTPEMVKLMEAFPSLQIAKVSTSRSFDVTVSDKQGNILDTYYGISAQMAGKIRNSNRKIGNRVNQIEVSNLSGEVIRSEFVPPEIHTSAVLDKPSVIVSKYDAKSAKRNAKYQQFFFGKANAELKRLNDRSNIHILVYEKISNKLCFSGNLGDAVTFIMAKIADNEWDDTSWVIYLPQKIYDLVTE